MTTTGWLQRAVSSIAVLIVFAAMGGVAAADSAGTNRVVYLTFDDGRALDSATSSLLDLLAAEGVTATFFVVGSNVDRDPQMIRRIAAGGHALGNHSYNHLALDAMSTDQIRAELVDTQVAVTRAGGPPMTCYRPPFGATSGLVRSTGASLGMSEELWTFSIQDWDRLDPGFYADQLVNVGDGDVVLLHDGFTGGETTVEAVRRFLRAEGDDHQHRTIDHHDQHLDTDHLDTHCDGSRSVGACGWWRRGAPIAVSSRSTARSRRHHRCDRGRRVPALLLTSRATP